MEFLNLFPLTIYKSELGLDETVRKNLIQEVYNQEKESKNNEKKMYMKKLIIEICSEIEEKGDSKYYNYKFNV